VKPRFQHTQTFPVEPPKAARLEQLERTVRNMKIGVGFLATAFFVHLMILKWRVDGIYDIFVELSTGKKSLRK